MEKLTIEEKAKRYDEAIKKAKDMLSYKEVRQEDIEYLFPELKESTENEDEKILKGLIDYFNDFHLQTFAGLDRKKILMWLEKQSEQKPFKQHDICDTCDEKALCVIPCPIKLVEQKSVDKIEPKFEIKEGKWYVCISQFCNCIKGKVYKATSDNRIMDDFGTEYDMHSDAYKYFRLWTIQDAKDGDVLFTSSTASHETFIFKSIDEKGNAKCYFAYDSEDGFREGKYHFIGRATNCKPATKEQRNTLMKAMADAGYTFDFEKKELRKIEQNPAWSEEDENRMNNLCHFLEEYGNQYYGHLTLQDTISWLKSLRPQLKRPWKPSKEQIMALKWALNRVPYDSYTEELHGLLEQLKQL